jgi:class 3 adenylate cyclase
MTEIISSADASARIRERKLTLVNVDLAGYTRAATKYEALELAAVLDEYYRRTAQTLCAHGGRVVKFMGDACFAVFPEERCADAVDAVLALERASAASGSGGLGLALGGNVHLAVVAEGELGPEDDRRYDVIGSGVNHLFRMGGGTGVRISEPVYRRLPDDRRGRWQKQKPPATYTHCG